MKKIIIGACLFVSINISAQTRTRMGYTPDEIKSEIGDLKLIKEGFNDNNIWHIQLEATDYAVTYFFTGESKCYASIMTPYSREILTEVVSLLNKKSVIITSRSWKTYFVNNIVSVLLKTSPKGVLYFESYETEE